MTTFLALLQSLPIALDDEPASRAWHESLQRAPAHDLSLDDAAYLEVALRRGLPLVSLDGKLKAAAQAVGVAEYGP